jgi:hypothetical protein
MSITQAIELLTTYNGPLGLKLHDGASEELINKVERVYGLNLPADFKMLYRFTDGFETVEDMFNMIPLSEIIAIKKPDKPLWIAEYMIYCDMWGLEANAANPDDYSVFNINYDSDKITLTKSLAEFISRFLKGGVFEIGGLYAWADEIKAKLYGNTDPNRIKPLLWVYRECLKTGLMTKQNVIDRADWIIGTEDEAHPFFSEMSLSRDTNELITILDSVNLQQNAIQIRAFLGEIYTRILIDQITSTQAISILDSFLHNELLTTVERDTIKALIVESGDLNNAILKSQRKQRLRENVKSFLENYRHFSLHHLKSWDRINRELVKKFESI